MTKYNLVFTKEPEGGYTVEVVELPGCVSYGETLEEAKENIKDAIKWYLVSLKKHKEAIPSQQRFISSLVLNKAV